MERRALWLYDNPTCAHCKAKGWLTPATEVDHVIALINGGADDDANLQSLCAEHHKEKTAKDLGHKRRVQIGPDGWPIL
jgi:5-methylcytosine-specific restriction protein A